ncbi:hypothetical protein BBJ28_00025425, partial [Nothophytophthora sp. Chile5]
EGGGGESACGRWPAGCDAMMYPPLANVHWNLVGAAFRDWRLLVCITAKELLPGAYRFDPTGKSFVPAFFIGIGIIAMSLVVLNYAGSS